MVKYKLERLNAPVFINRQNAEKDECDTPSKHCAEDKTKYKLHKYLLFYFMPDLQKVYSESGRAGVTERGYRP